MKYTRSMFSPEIIRNKNSVEALFDISSFQKSPFGLLLKENLPQRTFKDHTLLVSQLGHQNLTVIYGTDRTSKSCRNLRPRQDISNQLKSNSTVHDDQQSSPPPLPPWDWGIQCDQIGRFIGLWTSFKSQWQQLFCPKLPTILNHLC